MVFLYMTKYGVISFLDRSLGDFVLPVLLHTSVGTVTNAFVVANCIRLPEIVGPSQGMMYFPTNYVISAMAQVVSHQTDTPEA
jgi:hypothetical protein